MGLDGFGDALGEGIRYSGPWYWGLGIVYLEWSVCF